MPDGKEAFGRIDQQTWDDLVAAAREVYERAYVPYSNFPVGAALLTQAGEIIAGCNVENASIGATICAERTAMSRAVASGHQRFQALAVITGADYPAAPCGICRQFLAEFSDDLPILMVNLTGERQLTSLNELLPQRFSGSDFLPE